MRISINDVLPLLRCPESHAKLYIEGESLVSDMGFRYPIREGIIDLVKESNREQNRIVEAGYNKIKSLKYNFLITNPPWMAFVWGIGLIMAPLYLFKLSEAPAGWVLDVPCGSGIFSAPVYKSNPCTRFIAVDYSMEMLKSAKLRAQKKGLENVLFIRADVAELPFIENTFVGALSLNGFHAFPEPSTAGLEIGRVLQSNAPLLMTAACRGIRRISDYMIDRYMIPKGYFSNSLTAEEYASFLDDAGIRKLQVNMAGAVMIAKGYKI